MYYTHPGCRTSIFGENRAYCIRDFTVVGKVRLYGNVTYMMTQRNATASIVLQLSSRPINSKQQLHQKVVHLI